MSPLPAWLHTPPPTLGLHLDAGRVTAVLADRATGSPVIRAVASSTLPHGALVPSLAAANVLDRDAVGRAIREAVEQVGGRHRRVALAVPDTAAKVSILSFEQLPPNVRDLDQLIRLQLRKTMPFPVEQAQVAWSRGPETGAGATIVVAAMRRDIVEEYEAVCAAAGLHAGTVDLATFNVVNLALLGSGLQGDTLLVHVTPGYASIAVVRDGGLIFFRTRPADAAEPVPDVVHQTRMYYEDRLAGQGFARVLVVAGPDVAERERGARNLEALFETPVTMLTLDGVATFGDRLQASEALVGQVAPPAGLVLREMGA
jgi:type IV pilus assembly protein PilM